MASAFPAPSLVPARSPFASGRSYTSGRPAPYPHTATPSSARTSASSRKRTRNESPTRDWNDLGTSSTYSLGGPSPGFFNNDVGESPLVISPNDAPSPGFFSTDRASPSFASPAPLAHSRYQLAGGEATPSIAQSTTSDFFNYSPSVGNSVSDLGYRRGRPYHDEQSRSSASGFFSTAGQSSSTSERLPTALSRESNGRPRALPSTDSLTTHSSSTLTTSVLHTVSGVFGAVWNFCTAGSFQGFFAGGGKGYAMDGPTDHVDDDAEPLRTPSVWHDMNASGSSHLPGEFPILPPSSPASSTPAAKKVKKAHFDDDPARSVGSLTQSWVMVRDGSPAAVRRRTHGAASTASPASMRQTATPTRPALRRSSGVAPLMKPSPHHRTASAAGLRSPTRSPMHSRQNSSGTIEKWQQGGAAVRVPPDEEEMMKDEESPIVAETARFVKDMRRRDRREDRDIKRMNRALEDMIREAREALGTTVDVEMMGEGRDEDLW